MDQSGCMLHWFSFDLSISWYSIRVLFYLDWIGVGSLVKMSLFSGTQDRFSTWRSTDATQRWCPRDVVDPDIPETGFALGLADASLTETGYLGLFQRIEFCLLSLQSR